MDLEYGFKCIYCSDDVSFFHEISKGKILKSFQRKRSRARISGGLNKNINSWHQSIKRRASHKKKCLSTCSACCAATQFFTFTASLLILIMISCDTDYTVTLREKCPNKEFFLVCIFLYSDQKKLRIWTLFTQCKFRFSNASAKKICFVYL